MTTLLVITYLRDTVNLQQAAIERSQSAMECIDTMSLIRANQGDWPDVVFDR